MTLDLVAKGRRLPAAATLTARAPFGQPTQGRHALEGRIEG